MAPKIKGLIYILYFLNPSGLQELGLREVISCSTLKEANNSVFDSFSLPLLICPANFCLVNLHCTLGRYTLSFHIQYFKSTAYCNCIKLISCLKPAFVKFWL